MHNDVLVYSRQLLLLWTIDLLNKTLGELRERYPFSDDFQSTTDIRILSVTVGEYVCGSLQYWASELNLSSERLTTFDEWLLTKGLAWWSFRNRGKQW